MHQIMISYLSKDNNSDLTIRGYRHFLLEMGEDSATI
jgi:hypothetical protein